MIQSTSNEFELRARIILTTTSPSRLFSRDAGGAGDREDSVVSVPTLHATPVEKTRAMTSKVLMAES
jgi:hypothetical protein